MDYKITYTATSGKVLSVVYAASSAKNAEMLFNTLTNYRNEDSIISVEEFNSQEK